jgi:hypothetical protein
VRRGGESLRPVQSGRIQSYMILTIALAVLAGLLFVFIFPGQGGN